MLLLLEDDAYRIKFSIIAKCDWITGLSQSFYHILLNFLTQTHFRFHYIVSTFHTMSYSLIASCILNPLSNIHLWVLLELIYKLDFYFLAFMYSFF